MTTPIKFDVIGDPAAQPRPRSFALRGKGGKVIFKNGQPIIRVYESGTAEAWKSQVAAAAKAHTPFVPLQGPVRVDIEFRFSRPKAHYRTNGQLKPNAPRWHVTKPDRDNCEKAVTDTLKVLGMFADDCQVCAGEVSKVYQYFDASMDELRRPGATIVITQLEQPKAEKPKQQQPVLIGCEDDCAPD